jgi:phosphatidylinositol glycan class B
MQSVFENLRKNIVEGVAATYGETHFLQWTLDLGWGMLWFLPLAALLLALLYLGRRHNWGFIAIAAGTFIPLSFVAHKEVRYFYPAMPAVLVVVGAALGRLVGPRPDLPLRASIAWSTIVAALGLFVYLSFFGPLQKHFYRSRSYIEASVLMHQQDDLCGVGLIDVPWVVGGYTFLNRSVPAYFLSAEQESSMTERPYNYALTLPGDLARFPDYEVLRCWKEGEVFWQKDLLCVLATRSACKPVHLEYEMNRQMVDRGW